MDRKLNNKSLKVKNSVHLLTKQMAASRESGKENKNKFLEFQSN